MFLFDQTRAAYEGAALELIFARHDPGMRLDPIRSDLIAANLPITPEGKAIVEPTVNV